LSADIPEEDLKVIRTVEEKIFSSIRLGFDFSELNVLDDVNIGKRRLQELGSAIAVNNPEVSTLILEIARSVYFGRSPRGEVPDFFDAVIRLGGDRVKILIFSLTLFALGKGRDARVRAAKSAGISILGKLIAEEMNLKDELVLKVETGGLLSQLGRNMFMKARELGLELSDGFIERYEVAAARRIIERLSLDPFLKKTVDASVLEFDEDSLSLAGVIKLAEALVEDSFRRYGKLVIKSPLPDSENIVVKTPGSMIRQLFTILDIDEFLVIEEVPTERQREAERRRARRN
jgi:hypothetical protein